MNQYVTSLAPNTVIDAILEGIKTQIEAFKPFFVNFSSEDSGARTMAEGREGYARLINRIANQHVDSLSRSDDPTLLDQRLGYDDSLEKLRQGLMQIAEMVSNTQTCNGVDIMQFVDRYNAVLQANRTSNAALDEAMKEVDEWNKRFANKKDDGTNATTPPAS